MDADDVCREDDIEEADVAVDFSGSFSFSAARDTAESATFEDIEDADAEGAVADEEAEEVDAEDDCEADCDCCDGCCCERRCFLRSYAFLCVDAYSRAMENHKSCSVNTTI